METYKFETKLPGWTFRSKALMALSFGGPLAAVLTLSDQTLPLTPIERLVLLAITASLGTLLCLAFLVFVPIAAFRTLFEGHACETKLFVEPDSITAVSTYSSGVLEGRVLQRTVQRDRIKTVFDLKGPKGVLRGVGISETSQFGARMLGFIYLPANFPASDEIRCIAESWIECKRLL